MRTLYEAERKNCMRIIQREKRNFLNELLQEDENNYSQGSTKSFFRTIKQYTSFNPSLKATKNQDSETIRI